MKVLILEDSSERIKKFKKELARQNDLYFFDNVKDAINAVELLGPFDSYFLDHDLDDRVYVNSNEPNTGYQFAKFLSVFLKEKKLNPQIVAHTLNPAGAKNICDVLPTAVYVPFPSLFK